MKSFVSHRSISVPICSALILRARQVQAMFRDIQVSTEPLMVRRVRSDAEPSVPQIFLLLHCFSFCLTGMPDLYLSPYFCLYLYDPDGPLTSLDNQIRRPDRPRWLLTVFWAQFAKHSFEDVSATIQMNILHAWNVKYFLTVETGALLPESPASSLCLLSKFSSSSSLRLITAICVIMYSDFFMLEPFFCITALLY